jgi:hypothetical protein
MYQVIRKQIRPNINVNFFLGEDQVLTSTRQYLYMTYVATAKQLSMTKEVSEDGLTMTVKQLWVSRDDYLECKNDAVSVAMKTDFDAYIQANGIVFEVEESEV